MQETVVERDRRFFFFLGGDIVYPERFMKLTEGMSEGWKYVCFSQMSLLRVVRGYGILWDVKAWEERSRGDGENHGQETSK